MERRQSHSRPGGRLEGQKGTAPKRGGGTVRLGLILQQPSVVWSAVQDAERILFCHGVEPFQGFFIRRIDGEFVFLKHFCLWVPHDFGSRQYS